MKPSDVLTLRINFSVNFKRFKLLLIFSWRESSFPANKPKVLWAIVVFWVAEKCDGKQRRHQLKECTLTDSGFKLKANDVSYCLCKEIF